AVKPMSKPPRPPAITAISDGPSAATLPMLSARFVLSGHRNELSVALQPGIAARPITAPRSPFQCSEAPVRPKELINGYATNRHDHAAPPFCQRPIQADADRR